MSEAAPHSLCELFLRQSVNRLRHEYLPKIRICLDALDESQVWWRPNDAANSIGNLLLHLEGNLRQWMVHGLGGAIDVRRRDGEFEARNGKTKAELLVRLERVIREAEEVIANQDESSLVRRATIQGYWTTGCAAIYHVVEHFSGHTGQIIWITKMLTGRDLRFYDL